MKQDIHHHFIPEILKKYVEDLPEWSIEKTVEFIEEKGLDKAVLSLSFYDIDFGSKDEYIDFCRQVNLELRNHIQQKKGRIEGFGILPVPYEDSCIKELKNCLTYGFTGVVLYSNVKGVYPSSIEHENLFKELDQGNVKVFIHPGSDLNTNNRSYNGIIPEIEDSLDVSRLTARLFAEDAFDKYPGIRYLLGHGGGLFAYQFSRLGKLVYFANKGDKLKMRWGRILGDLIKKKSRVLDYLNRIEIDLFDFERPEQLAALKANIPLENCHFGSNFPCNS
jgi:6-methylsalicylate decarboxylase